MCHEEPGPRCSDHARAARDAAREALAAAHAHRRATETHLADIRARHTGTPGTPDDELPVEHPDVQAATCAYWHASKAETAAEADLAAADAAYALTPAGQADTEAELTLATAAGDHALAARLQASLDDARTTYHRQEAALTAARNQQRHLTALNPVEQDAIAQADADVDALDRALDAHRELRDRLQARLTDLEPAYQNLGLPTPEPASAEPATAPGERGSDEHNTHLAHRYLTAKIADTDRSITVLAACRDAAATQAHRVRAHIGAGFGTNPARLASLTADPLGSIVRDIDGAPTTFLYRPPSPGLPHGWYEDAFAPYFRTPAVDTLIDLGSELNGTRTDVTAA